MHRKCVIVDYGMGNLHSLQRILSSFNIPVVITNQASEIKSASHIVLPGVGHFGHAMKQLKQNELVDVLNHMALVERKPILGICLGMQLMTAYSEEGECKGLGWFSCNTVSLAKGRDVEFKIPHLGWNTLAIKQQHSIFANITSSDELYFVHGFGVLEAVNEHVLCTTEYGGEVISGLVKDNLFGLQFHPEKSLDSGHRILSNFINICIDPA
jgi:imidazole glycerol-phosphate synthase subunit HisH